MHSAVGPHRVAGVVAFTEHKSFWALMKCSGGSVCQDWSVKMDMNTTSPMAAPPPLAEATAPPPAEPDGRPAADAVATRTDPRPDLPMPIPASGSQGGLISRAALSDKDAAPKLDASGASAAERMLKPYGITMLPERQDPTEQDRSAARPAE